MDEIKTKVNVMKQLMGIIKKDYIDCFAKYKGYWDMVGRSQGKHITLGRLFIFTFIF